MKTATELAAAASIFARWAADMKPTDSDPYAQARKLIQYHLLAAANKAREIAESMENAPREAKPCAPSK